MTATETSGLPTRLRAETTHLVRYLMSESPQVVEKHRLLIPDPDWVQLRSGVRRIVEIVSSADEGPTHYFVIDGFTVKTTTTLPPWAAYVTVEQVTEEPDETLLWRRLQDLHAEFERYGAGDAFPLNLDWFASHYAGETAESIVAGLPLGRIVGLLPRDLGRVLSSPQAAHEWSVSSLRAVQQAYHRFQVTGAAAAPMAAALLLIARSPVSDQLLCLGTVGQLRDGHDALELAVDPASSPERGGVPFGDGVSVTPVGDIGYYATTFGLRDTVSVHWAHETADALRDTGTAQLVAVRDVTGIEEHYFRLYDAMFWFLAANEAYAYLERLYDHVGPPERPALKVVRDERVMFEEWRATIHAALAAPAKANPASHDFSDFPDLWRLLWQLRAQPSRDAEKLLMDLSLRLLIPRFLRDIGIGWVKLGSPATFDRGVRILQRTIERLEADFARHLGSQLEPNYAAVAYDCLVVGAEQAGHTDAAARFSRTRDAAAARVRAAAAEWLAGLERTAATERAS